MVQLETHVRIDKLHVFEKYFQIQVRTIPHVVRHSTWSTRVCPAQQLMNQNTSPGKKSTFFKMYHFFADSSSLIALKLYVSASYRT
jgi:hypothetical protein